MDQVKNDKIEQKVKQLDASELANLRQEYKEVTRAGVF